MTDRLYYVEPARLVFEARVVAVRPHERGTAVELDATAFYPTSGGQPFDTGTLGAARVLDVFDDEKTGEVVHVTDRALEVGERVEGRIDAARRRDHMQQHTGQHILSAAFVQVCGARTESFHLGAERSTIDLAHEVTPDEIAAAEMLASRVVWEDRPVSIRFVSSEEAARLPLRKEPVRGGRLRLIDVEGFDLSACGGTHVARTGEIGIIAVSGWERFKGGARVEFLCGERALKAFRAMRDVLTAAIRSLTVSQSEVPAAIDRLQESVKDQRRLLKALTGRLAAHEAVALAARAADVGGFRVVVEAIEGFEAGDLRSVASSVLTEAGRVCVLFTAAAPFSVVIGRSEGVALDASALLRALVERFGGRGGGKADLAQGGGLTGTREEVLAACRALVTREL